MNLNMYDDVIVKIDRTKSWVQIDKKILFSKYIKYRPYYCLLKRYNTLENQYQYYIAVMDKPVKGRNCKNLNRDFYGRTIIRLNSIWNDAGFDNIDKDCNIDVEYLESQDDGDIYFINI